MHREEVGRIVQGGVYRFHQLTVTRRGDERVVEDLEGGLVRVECFAFDAVDYRDVVVFVAVDGLEMGRYFVCSLHRFACHYRPEQLSEPPAPALEPPPEPPPEKVAGSYQKGSGV